MGRWVLLGLQASVGHRKPSRLKGGRVGGGWHVLLASPAAFASSLLKPGASPSSPQSNPNSL